MRYEPNPALDSLVPAGLKARVEAAADSIAAGTLLAAPRPASMQASTAGHGHRRPAREHVGRGAARRARRRYLDDYLRIREVPDERNAVNGLQVENRGTDRRHRGGGGRLAGHDRRRHRRLGPRGPAPLLLVHHGLFWDGNVPLTGRRYRRVAALLEHDIAALRRAHPARSAPEVGNNVVLAERLGSRSKAGSATTEGAPIGVWGHAPARLVPARGARGRGEPRAGHARRPGRSLIAGGPERVGPGRHHHRRRRAA